MGYFANFPKKFKESKRMSTENTHFGAEKISKMLDKSKCKKIFFCGIGGINMSSLAEMSLGMGYDVSGSDRTESELTRALEKAGAKIYYTQKTENVEGADAFVYTVAIAPDNPEYVRAGEMGIPRISRADFLGYVMTTRKMRIGISGTHGKSTTTAMCHSIFESAGVDPTVMCGSALAGIGSPYKAGKGEHFIFEACEYMDSFLDFNPTAAVILNVEMDHVDYFHSIEQTRESYTRFAKITEKTERGAVIYNADDENSVRSVENYKGRKLSFGIEKEATFMATDIEIDGKGSSFTVLKDRKFYTKVDLSVFGKHNVYDALAATAAAYYGGISAEDTAKGLAAFVGTHRRMEYRGKRNGARLYDDYAHHPTEIRASLSAARAMAGESGRVVVVFQSHTYSRTAALLGGFGETLSLADKVFVAPIYAARETNTLGVDQYVLAERIGESAEGCADIKTAAEKLASFVKDGDVAIIMGAGNIDSAFSMIDFER